MSMFLCVGLLKSQHIKSSQICFFLYLGGGERSHILATEVWEVFFVHFFHSSFLTRKAGCNYSQVLNHTELRVWCFFFFFNVKPTRSTIPWCTISQHHWFSLLCRPGYTCKENHSYLDNVNERGQKGATEPPQCRWYYWCRSVTLGQFLSNRSLFISSDLLLGILPTDARRRSRAPSTLLLHQRCPIPWWLVVRLHRKSSSGS